MACVARPCAHPSVASHDGPAVVYSEVCHGVRVEIHLRQLTFPAGAGPAEKCNLRRSLHPLYVTAARCGPRDQVTSVRLWHVRPADIGGHNLLDRFRLDAEFLEARPGAACDVVCLEKVNLAGGERWVWQEFEQARQYFCHRERDGHKQPPLTDEP